MRMMLYFRHGLSMQAGRRHAEYGDDDDDDRAQSGFEGGIAAQPAKRGNAASEITCVDKAGHHMRRDARKAMFEKRPLARGRHRC